jgi:hypothetical protein
MGATWPYDAAVALAAVATTSAAVVYAEVAARLHMLAPFKNYAK